MERIAIISDIHGNLTALEAVLAELDRQGVDQVYCLGDVAYRGPFPAECVDLLRRRSIPTIYGNTDRWLVEPPQHVLSEPAHAGALAWCQEQLGPERLAWLGGLPFSLTVELGGMQLLLVHGSPRSENEFTYPWLSEAELAEILAGVTAGAVAVGHHHRQFMRRTPNLLLVGPGSAGLPADGDFRAACAVLAAADGQLLLQLIRVPYDRKGALRQAAVRAGYPDLPWFREYMGRAG